MKRQKEETRSATLGNLDCLDHPVNDLSLDHPVNDLSLDHPVNDLSLDHPVNDLSLDHPVKDLNICLLLHLCVCQLNQRDTLHSLIQQDACKGFVLHH